MVTRRDLLFKLAPAAALLTTIPTLESAQAEGDIPTMPVGQDFASPEELIEFIDRLDAYVVEQQTETKQMTSLELAGRIRRLLVELATLMMVVEGEARIQVRRDLLLEQDTKFAFAVMAHNLRHRNQDDWMANRLSITDSLWGRDDIPVPERVTDFDSEYFQLQEMLVYGWK